MLKPMHTASKDRRVGEEERRRGGKEERRRGGEEERRREGEKERRRGEEAVKPMRLCTKDERTKAVNAPRSWLPGGPALRSTFYMRPHSFASPARTHGTKRKRRRNEANLPVTGGRINRTSSLKRPIYIYIYLRIHVNLFESIRSI